jgi:hypothetical protein
MVSIGTISKKQLLHNLYKNIPISINLKEGFSVKLIPVGDNIIFQFIGIEELKELSKPVIPKASKEEII